ncbi:MAG: glycosyltransferase family 4 protein, partial [Acidobacteria bacterium]|nr:glycosyltransferase family 4 protein [Acidobacteriota bacterium]
MRTGVGRYASNLLEQLLLLDPAPRILLVTDQYPPPSVWMRSDRIQVLKVPSRWGNNFLWTNLSLVRQLKARAFDIFYSPGYTLPLRLKAPSVVSLHDISYAACPEWYPYKNGAVRKIWYRLSARRADRILTLSEFSRREIVRVYGIPAERIHVIPPGVDRRTFSKIHDPERLEGLKKKYGLSGDFLLFVGDIHRRRNLNRIVDAFHAIRTRGFEALELVLIGRMLEPPALAIQASGVPQNPHIRLLGYVPEEDLVLFYSLAKAFVFPSFYEGFGLG